MRDFPICPLPDFFVSHEDSRGRYVEVNFEKRADAMRYIAKLKRMKTEAELWTRARIYPKVK